MTGPVTTQLEADLHDYVRKHGLVYWQDRHRQFVDVAERLAAEPDARVPVLVYRDSFLELMVALEHVCTGLQPERTVVYLPGFTDGDLDDTPLLEITTIGRRFRKALPTLVQEAGRGLLPPEALTALSERDDLTLEAADHALSLASSDTDPWLRAQSPAALLDALATPPETWRPELTLLMRSDPSSRPLDVIRRWAESHLGVDDRWIEATGGLPEDLAASPARRADAVRFLLGSHALCVEYVHDLQGRRPQTALLAPLASLPGPLVQANRQLAARLRQAKDPIGYRLLATETAQLIPEDDRKVLASELGNVDTFAFEEETILEAAIEAVREEDWTRVLTWATARQGDGCFWTSGPQPEDQARRSAWALLHAAARLGQAVGEAGPRLSPHAGPLSSLREGLLRYTQAGAHVDRAHRKLVEAMATRLDTRLPRFEALRDALRNVQETWSTWADTWARDWSAIHDIHGPLPGPDLQQRTLFEECVEPEVRRDRRTVAYFLIDALRFEMAAELAERLQEEADTDLGLQGRLAELPTNTDVGMNVLAPVADQGRLTPVLSAGPGPRQVKGFKVGSYTVSRPEHRQRAMADRLGQPVAWMTVREACTTDPASLRKTVSRKRLVVVHGLEIDEAGEKGHGPLVFDNALQDLVDAWRRLREAGVKVFVVTADHGFLLREPGGTGVVDHGRPSDVFRRHLLTDQAEDRAETLRLTTEDLGWTTDPGLYLITPRATHLFHDGKLDRDFVHGGTSLQERVIPVLTIRHKRAAGSTEIPYVLHGTMRPGVAGMHCIEVEVRSAHTISLGYAKESAVRVTLQPAEGADVRLQIADVRGGTRAGLSGLLAAPDTKVEVFFHLQAPSEQRVPIRLVHTGTLDVQPFTLAERFLASAQTEAVGDAAVESATMDAPASRTPRAPGSDDWLQAIDPAWRDAVRSIAEHGSLDEPALIAMLGSARKARRFAARIEQIATLTPFDIVVKIHGGTKLYKRVGADKETP